MHRLPSLVATTLALTLFAVGCGSDDNGSKASSSGGATVKVEAADFSFDPTSISLTADEASTLEIDNKGKVEHNITIEGTDVNKDLEAGETTKVSVKAKAGTYKFHCKYHPTQMTGTVTVK